MSEEKFNADEVKWTATGGELKSMVVFGLGNFKRVDDHWIAEEDGRKWILETNGECLVLTIAQGEDTK